MSDKSADRKQSQRRDSSTAASPASLTMPVGASSFRALCERVGENILSCHTRFVHESASTPGQLSGHDLSALPATTEVGPPACAVFAYLSNIMGLARFTAGLIPATCPIQFHFGKTITFVLLPSSKVLDCERGAVIQCAPCRTNTS